LAAFSWLMFVREVHLIDDDDCDVMMY